MKSYLLSAAIVAVILSGALASGAFLSGAALADEAVAPQALTYNLSVTNDYVWRGVSQNHAHPAIQGGIDFASGIGYAGVWASSTQFGDQTELDLYAGVRPTLGKLTFDIGAINYSYGKDNYRSLANTELKLAASYPIQKGTIGAVYYYNLTDSKLFYGNYYEVNGAYPVTDKLSVSGAIGGYTAGERNGAYTTGNIGLTYALTPVLSIDGRYWATDIQKDNASWATPVTNYNYPTTPYKDTKGRVAVVLKATF